MSVLLREHTYLSVRPPDCLSVCYKYYISISLSILLSILLSVFLNKYPSFSVWTLIYKSDLYLSVSLYMCVPFFLNTYLPLSEHNCLSVHSYLSIILTACLPVWTFQYSPCLPFCLSFCLFFFYFAICQFKQNLSVIC